MIAQIIVTPPDAFLNAVRLIILQVVVQLLELHLELLVTGVHPVKVESRDCPVARALGSNCCTVDIGVSRQCCCADQLRIPLILDTNVTV